MDSLSIENLIDRIFGGDGPRAHVARLVCRCERPLSPEKAAEIMESVRKAFPNAFEVGRRSSLRAMLQQVQQAMDEAMSEPAMRRQAMSPGKIGKVIDLLRGIADEYGISDAYFVGGYPRTIAMGLPLSDVKDMDVASASPQKAAQLAGFVSEKVRDAFRIKHRSMTVTMDVFGIEVDFQAPGSHEDTLPYIHLAGLDPSPISKNIFDRDFTINSLAIPLGSNEIIDLTRRGMADIEDRIVASIIPADQAVPKNPLMITRAVRFARRYNFKIDAPLWEAMVANVGELRKQISPKRLAIEAFILSKLDAQDMLREAGLEYLAHPSWEDIWNEGEKQHG